MKRRAFVNASTAAFAAAAMPAGAACPAPPSSLPVASRVVRCGDAGYDAARAVLNRRIDVRPEAIAYCESDAEVARTIAWANAEGLPLSIRGGPGHDFEGFSVIDGGVVIDLSAMNAITVDRDARRARIEPGANLGSVYAELGKFGFTLPGGTCKTVGIAGITTGGGFGVLSRTHGLLCDRLRRVRMVDARGRLHDSASDAHGGELLWASRGGGGGNFGVITLLEFEPVDVPSQVATFALRWRWSEANVRNVLTRWHAWLPGAPRNLFTSLALLNEANGSFAVSGWYLGPSGEAGRLVSSAFAGVAPDHATFDAFTYEQAVERNAVTADASESFRAKSTFGREPLDARAIDVLVDAQRRRSFGGGLVQFDSLGGAIGDVAPGATAFVHRDARYSIGYQATWKDATKADARVAWLREIYAAMAPYVPAASYRNYTDLDLEDWPARYYGANYARLQHIKQRYDPTQRFRFAQSIVPA